MKIADGDNGLLSPEARQEEFPFETNLRPRLLSDFTGQDRIRGNLQIFIDAAIKRKEPLDHVLFFGPPGLGKTTLSVIIANEMGVNIRTTSGPVLDRPGDLAAILTSLSDKDVLFIDEIHRLPKTVEEMLYPAMEDYRIDIIIGQGSGAKTMRFPLPRFTLIGATTRTGLLTSPMRDRFGVSFRLDFYAPDELSVIIGRSARLLNVPVEQDAAEEIARRSRGTPRIANRLLKRVRDFAQVKGDGIITLDVAHTSLEALDVDQKGLDDTDRRLLLTLIRKFSGGPAGIEALAAALREDKDTIEDVYEPFLLQEGLIERTARGRLATRLAYEHLDIQKPAGLFST